MKTLMTLLIGTMVIVSCKAQSPIISIYDGDEEQVDGCYLKDVDGDFNPYVATWKWEDGNNSITIRFEKVEAYYRPDMKQYYDYLVGGYSYIENGVEITNSLNFTLNGAPYSEDSNNTIVGRGISTNDGKAPPCNECDPNTRMVDAHIIDPVVSGVSGTLRMKHFIENGVEKIRVRITNSYTDIDTPVGTSISIPEGIYTFVKQ